MSWLDIAKLHMVVAWENAENTFSDACFGSLGTLENKLCSHVNKLMPRYTQAYIRYIKVCANFHMPRQVSRKTRHPYLGVTEYVPCGQSRPSIKLIQYNYISRILCVRSLSIYT